MEPRLTVSKIAKTVKGAESSYYRARLSFPFDPTTGIKPPDKEFYATTDREARTKAGAYKLPNQALDKKTRFVDYIVSEYLPQQQTRTKLEDIEARLSWGYFVRRRRRLTRYLLAPVEEGLRSATLREAKIGYLSSEMMEAYFRSLELCGVSAENRRSLKDDIATALKPIRRKLPEPLSEYFVGIKVPKVERRERLVFDVELIFGVIIDEDKPLMDRSLVAFQFFTMCRPSEMFALTWEDIDLRAGKVLLNKAMRSVDGGFAVSDGSKIGPIGDRQFDLNPTLLALLRSLRKTSMATNKQSNHVFTTLTGMPITGWRWNKNVWPRVRKNLSLPNGPTFYSLKASGNSYTRANGSSAEANMKIMGQRSTRMGSTVYRVVMPEETANVHENFERGIAKARALKSAQGGENPGKRWAKKA
jgi:integrase